MNGDRSSFDDLNLTFFDDLNGYSVSSHVVCTGKRSSSVLKSFCEQSDKTIKTCNLSSKIPKGITVANVDSLLNFMYEMDLDTKKKTETPDSNVALYVLGRILVIPELVNKTIKSIRDCCLETAARHLVTIDRLSSASSDSDSIVLELQPIVDHCLEFCASNLSSVLDSVQSFVESLGVNQQVHVQKILTKAVERGGSLSNLQVCSFVVACSRVDEVFFPLLSDLIVEINSIDAVFVFVLIKKFNMSSSNLNSICAPFLVESELCKKFNMCYEDLGLLQASEHEMLLNFLDRDDLNATNEVCLTFFFLSFSRFWFFSIFHR